MAYKVSERRTCRVLDFHRPVHRYQSIAKDRAFLIKQIKEIATIRSRYGYRRIHTLLQREGGCINHKRVYRLYRRRILAKSYTKRKKYIHNRDGDFCCRRLQNGPIFGGKTTSFPQR